jgi:hypothetical protein
VSEQYFTSCQFFVHRFRQVIGRPQVAQGLVGRKRLLPLNAAIFVWPVYGSIRRSCQNNTQFDLIFIMRIQA